MILFISGCTNAPTTGTCTTDVDCGEPRCEDNLKTLITPTCSDGICGSTTTKCGEYEICVQNSTGASCMVKEESPLPWMSCGDNSNAIKGTGINPFSVMDFQCKDDCPVDTTCDTKTCLCEENQQPPQPPPNNCPTPKFTNKYFDPPAVDYDFDAISDMYLDEMSSDSIRELDEGFLAPTTINIPAYEHMRGEEVHYLPFPTEQLKIQTIEGPVVWVADDPNIQPGGCANDYFVGDKAVDINLNVLEYPTGEYDYCSWGGADSFMGVLTICPDDLADWLDRAIEEGTVDLLGILP